MAAASVPAGVVEVAAAVIVRADGAFLLARRPPGKVCAGYWEFPGGKIEPDEPAERALARELHEELGIDVRRAYAWITRVYAYPHATVRLNFFRVLEWAGEPHPREAQQLVWQRMDSPFAEPMLPANAPVLASLALPHEYAITAADIYGIEPTLARLAQRLEAGLKLVQVRDKTMTPRARSDFAMRVVELAHRRGGKVLIHSDEALARSLGADGVHYSAHELAGLDQRPRDLLAAGSCHAVAELEQAVRLGLDFAVLGPVKHTTSHPGAVPLGWGGFARIARGAAIPVYGIGGLRRADVEQAWRAGAHGVAMISGAWED